jgi:CheY-like chemotaxis protein
VQCPLYAQKLPFGSAISESGSTRRIKADASPRSIPIIAVTSYALSGEGQKARVAGCDDYVTKPFSPLATIGRQAAVADFGGVRVRGAPAWWLWGTAHIAFLIGVRNRFTVLATWLWAYLTFRRGSRLITGAGL